jgi:hypothetical protein
MIGRSDVPVMPVMFTALVLETLMALAVDDVACVCVVGRSVVVNTGGLAGLLTKSYSGGGFGVVVVVVVVVVEVVVVEVDVVVLLVVIAVVADVLASGLLGFLVRYTPAGLLGIGLCGLWPMNDPDDTRMHEILHRALWFVEIKCRCK